MSINLLDFDNDILQIVGNYVQEDNIKRIELGNNHNKIKCDI